jgi:hypothetical protein
MCLNNFKVYQKKKSIYNIQQKKYMEITSKIIEAMFSFLLKNKTYGLVLGECHSKSLDL